MKKGLSLCLIIILSYNAKAQVPVNQEPRHHVVFENSRVRILNVVLPPGDTSQYHIHSTPSVFIGLTTTPIGSQLIHQEPRPGNFSSGSVFFENLKAPHNRIHRVWNMDSSVFHVIDIELLSKDSGFNQEPFHEKYTRLETDTPWVRIYKIELPGNEQLSIHEDKRTFIVVALSDSKIEVAKNNQKIATILSAGNFFWLAPGDKLTLANPLHSTAAFALMEIP